MEYRSGSLGRVFLARFDQDDDLLQGLTELVAKETVHCGWFFILGGLKHARVVTGPREPTMPPEPIWQEVFTTRETLGVGSVFFDGENPRFHLHGAMGHHGETLTACIREKTKVYLVMEVLLLEVSGIPAGRPWYEEGGFHRLSFGGGDKKTG